MKHQSVSTVPSSSGEVVGDYYDSSFYQSIDEGSKESALVILGLLFQIYRPKSILDLGCGQGSWLAAAEQLGCDRLLGFDGPWVDPNAMLCKRCEFRPTNFEHSIVVDGKFDLAISLEVAEHVSFERSRAFITTLCNASDVIVFSAAITNQGGTHHINEQQQSFWASHFKALDYDCFDLFRPSIWDDNRVEVWYRQNVFLYVKSSHPIVDDVRKLSLRPGPLNIVHPDIFEGNLETLRKAIEGPTFKFCLNLFARWSRRRLRKVFRQ